MVDVLDINKLGFYDVNKEEVVSVYHKFYPLEKEEKYGVVVFEVELI
jgi:ASC-1-like (ASCH) protein